MNDIHTTCWWYQFHPNVLHICYTEPWSSLWSSFYSATAKVDVYCSCLKTLSLLNGGSTLCAVSDRLLNPPEWWSLNWALPACSAKSCTSINPLIGALAIVRRRGKEQGFAHCSKLWIRVANVNAWLGSYVVSSELCVLLL